MKKKWWIFTAVLILLLATTPIFFDIYRTAAFNTVPRDDYAPYLLFLLGYHDKIPGAPFAYRILSVAVAIPFYFLPTYTFTNLKDIEIEYLRATQALSLASYFSLVLTAAVIYALSRKLGATRISALTAGLLSLLLSNFISRVGIDPLAILAISLLILWLDKSLAFVPCILISVGLNEKIPILFATILICRFLYSIAKRRRFRYYVQLFSSCLAVVIYFAATVMLKIPGHEEQTNPAFFLSNWQSTLTHSISPKGLFLNVLPVLVLAALALFAIKSQRPVFWLSDLSGMLVLLTLALTANLGYTVGRIVMYSYPLYLPAATCFIEEMLTGKEASRCLPTIDELHC